MTPLTFSLKNALDILPDDYRRMLTAEAREFAKHGKDPRTDFGQAETYWVGVVNEHKRILWMDAYEKRKARLSRIAAHQAGKLPDAAPESKKKEK